MSGKQGLVLLGFGGHARSVADVAITAGYRRLLFVDDNATDGEVFLDFRVQRSMPVPSSDWIYMPCAGDNHKRHAQVRKLIEVGLPMATVISPRSTVGNGASLADGCFVGHHAHIGPVSMLGTGCIINTAAVVEHDCIVGDFCHMSVHSTVAGRGRLGDHVFLGAGAVVIDGISIAGDVVVGAGGVVVTSLQIPGVYVGAPVRRIGSDPSLTSRSS